MEGPPDSWVLSSGRHAGEVAENLAVALYSGNDAHIDYCHAQIPTPDDQRAVVSWIALRILPTLRVINGSCERAPMLTIDFAGPLSPAAKAAGNVFVTVLSYEAVGDTDGARFAFMQADDRSAVVSAAGVFLAALETNVLGVGLTERPQRED